MSNSKKFEVELFNPQTEEIEKIIKRTFVSVEDVYDAARVADKFESNEMTIVEQLDVAMEIIIDAFKDKKTKDDKEIDENIILKRMDGGAFIDKAIEILQIKMGNNDPKVEPEK